MIAKTIKNELLKQIFHKLWFVENISKRRKRCHQSSRSLRISLLGD
jgi:hypothetical protein